MSEKLENPSRRGFFGTAASAAAVIAASPALPVIPEVAATAAAPTSMAAQLEMVRATFTKMNMTMSVSVFDATFRQLLIHLHKAIEKETGIAYGSIESFMHVANELERSAPTRVEEYHDWGRQFTVFNPEYIRSAIMLETLTKQNPELVKAARYAAMRMATEVEKLNALNMPECDNALQTKVMSLSVAKTLTAPDGSIEELLANAHKKIETAIAELPSPPLENYSKYGLLEFALNGGDNSGVVQLPKTIALLKQSALVDITTKVSDGYLAQLQVSCPHGTLASLTLTPLAAGTNNDKVKVAESEQLEKDNTKAKALMMAQYRAHARQYLIEHPIDLNAEDFRSSASKLARSMGIDTDGYNLSVDDSTNLPDGYKSLRELKAEILKKHPEFFVQSDLTPEQRSAAARDIGRAMKILSNAVSLASLLAQMADDAVPTHASAATTEMTEVTAARSQGTQLLLDYVQSMAPAGALTMDGKTGAVEILDTALKAQVAEARMALAREAAAAAPPQPHADGPRAQIHDAKKTGEIVPTAAFGVRMEREAATLRSASPSPSAA